MMQAPFQLTIFKGWSQNHLFHRLLLLPYLHIRYFGSHQQIWAVCVEIEFKCWNLKWIDNKAVASALCTRPRKVPLGKSWESGDPLFREREFRHDLWTVCVCYCVYTHVYMCVCVRTCVSQCVRMCVFVVSVCVLPLGTISGEREARISDYRPPPPPLALHTSTEKLCTNTIAHFAHFGTSANLPHTKKANLLFMISWTKSSYEYATCKNIWMNWWTDELINIWIK